MKYLRFVLILGLMTITFLGCGDKGGSAAKASAPAKIDNPVKESSLTTVTLTPQAEERLGITTTKSEIRPLARTRRVSGEITAVPGYVAHVAAPAAGIILPPQSRQLPMAGANVKRGQEILRLLLLPAEKELIGTREEVVVKQKQYEVALAKAKRTAQLLADKATSQKADEQAQAELAAAEAALKAAQAKLQLMTETALDEAAANLSTMSLHSPVDGVLDRLSVAAGQTVPASSPLFDVVDLDPVWVRVLVYSGDLAIIDTAKPAFVGSLKAKPGAEMQAARPVQGPPLSHAETVSSELFYELANPGSAFRIGQKVGVKLPLREMISGVVVPFASVLYDMNGGTWVYIRSGSHDFTRRRIEVAQIVDDFALIARGLAGGDEVVIHGAAELFGTEFGGGK
jgi:cobalt-zinc-cadmium efflux system membrane fusion protein